MYLLALSYSVCVTAIKYAINYFVSGDGTSPLSCIAWDYDHCLLHCLCIAHSMLIASLAVDLYIHG